MLQVVINSILGGLFAAAIALIFARKYYYQDGYNAGKKLNYQVGYDDGYSAGYRDCNTADQIVRRFKREIKDTGPELM